MWLHQCLAIVSEIQKKKLSCSPSSRHGWAGCRVADRLAGLLVCGLDDANHSIKKPILFNDCEEISHAQDQADSDVTLMSKPLSLLYMDRLRRQCHEVALDNEIGVFLAEEVRLLPRA